VSVPATLPDAPAHPSRLRGALQGLLWLGQRLSALLIAVGLVLHLAAIHLTPGAGVSFREVAARLASPGWRAFEAAFLVAVTFHAVGGLRIIVEDYVTTPLLRRYVLLLLVILAAEVLALGLYTLASLPGA